MPQPCTPWISGDEVQDCCSVESTSGFEFDSVAITASQLLFELSGRLFPGECGPRTVRPPCICSCGYQVLSRGHIVGPWDWGYWNWNLCDFCLVSCSPSMVKLAGYPVRDILQVWIDGVELADSEFVIYQRRYLKRTNDGRWPIQQDLTLPHTEEGTWAVTYTYGADPPQAGMDAAAELACELYKACQEATSGDCVLPKGVTRVTRQGIVIEKLAFTNWAFTPSRYARGGRAPGWNTGLPLVDAFLSTYARAGLIRRPTFWAPGKRQYAQGFGQP